MITGYYYKQILNNFNKGVLYSVQQKIVNVKEQSEITVKNTGKLSTFIKARNVATKVSSKTNVVEEVYIQQELQEFHVSSAVTYVSKERELSILNTGDSYCKVQQPNTYRISIRVGEQKNIVSSTLENKTTFIFTALPWYNTVHTSTYVKVNSQMKPSNSGKQYVVVSTQQNNIHLRSVKFSTEVLRIPLNNYRTLSKSVYVKTQKQATPLFTHTVEVPVKDYNFNYSGNICDQCLEQFLSNTGNSNIVELTVFAYVGYKQTFLKLPETEKIEYILHKPFGIKYDEHTVFGRFISDTPVTMTVVTNQRVLNITLEPVKIEIL